MRRLSYLSISIKILLLLFILLLILLFRGGSLSVSAAAATTPYDADRNRSVRKVLLQPEALPRPANKERVVCIQMPVLNVKPHAGRVPLVEGIDVSHYQGRIDWGRVATEGGAKYAYVKATEGGDMADEYYSYNIREAKAAGLLVGAYHFYRPQRGVDANFKNMVSVIKRRDIDLLPIIDVETVGGLSREQFIADLQQFVKRVERHYGCPPMLYTGQNFYNKHFQGVLTDYCWMIAKYQEEPPILLDGHIPCMWQYTQHGSVSGIRGNVDRSRLLNGSLHHLKIK